MDYGTWWYSPVLGRFLSADTIVPEPGDPQSLNRYSYVRNNPLVRIDPTGHEDCADGDTQCWIDQWVWNNRWYEAHGFFSNPNGSGWNVHYDSQGNRLNARFADPGILEDTLHDAGIYTIVASWNLRELTLIAQGVVALANKLTEVAGFGIADGFRRLDELLGGDVHFMRGGVSILGAGVWACVCDFAHTVEFFSPLFNESDYVIRGTAVHELAHVMDFRGQLFSVGGLATNYTGVFPHGRHISDRAMLPEFNGIEYWGEALADWVYGGQYKENEPRREHLSPNQNDWLTRMLLGWGW